MRGVAAGYGVGTPGGSTGPGGGSTTTGGVGPRPPGGVGGGGATGGAGGAGVGGGADAIGGNDGGAGGAGGVGIPLPDVEPGAEGTGGVAVTEPTGGAGGGGVTAGGCDVPGVGGGAGVGVALGGGAVGTVCPAPGGGAPVSRMEATVVPALPHPTLGSAQVPGPLNAGGAGASAALPDPFAATPNGVSRPRALAPSRLHAPPAQGSRCAAMAQGPPGAIATPANDVGATRLAAITKARRVDR